MIKNQKRTTSAEDDYILTGVSYTTPTVTKTPTNKTNKNMVLTIQKKNFWKEEAETDAPTATITIPLSDYALRTYLEENYYNKTAIDGFIEQYKIKVVVLESVNNLPKSGDSRYADTSYLFLVRHTHDTDSSSQKDYFDEYIWNNDKSDYERIGNTDIDLTPYMKIADFNTWVSETLNPQITTINNAITQLQKNKEDISNKVTSLSSSSKNTQYPSAKLVYDQLALKENSSNKVTSINSSSTNTQYPSAKLLYDQLALKENSSNKVTFINSSSTDTQYPSAKLLYDQLKLKENTANKTTTINANSTDTQYPTALAVYTGLLSKLNKSDAFSGNYNDLSNKPSIPTKITDLNNDANFITLNDIPDDIGLQIYTVNNESEAIANGIYIVSPENHPNNVYSLSLSADKDIVSIGESITFQTILKKNNEPVPYENLLLVIEDTKIGAVTDKNGVATFIYEGQGYGVVDASVFYNVFLQETYEVMDCLAYDNGTLAKHNDIWLNTAQSGVIFERKAEYTEFGITTSANKYIPLNLSLNSQNIIIEFDVLLTNHSDGAFADINYQNNRVSSINLQNVGAEDNVWIPVKLVLNNGTITLMNKNTSQSKVLAENSNWDSFRLLNYSVIDKTTLFKNFKVYSV